MTVGIRWTARTVGTAGTVGVAAAGAAVTAVGVAGCTAGVGSPSPVKPARHGRNVHDVSARVGYRDAAGHRPGRAHVDGAGGALPAHAVALLRH